MIFWPIRSPLMRASEIRPEPLGLFASPEATSPEPTSPEALGLILRASSTPGAYSSPMSGVASQSGGLGSAAIAGGGGGGGSSVASTGREPGPRGDGTVPYGGQWTRSPVRRASRPPLPALLWLPVYLYRLSLPMPACLLSSWPLPMLCHYYTLHPDCADCIAVRRRPTLAQAAPQR